MHNFQYLINQMVNDQIIKRGITDPQVIQAMGKVPRHKFVPEEEVKNVYEDCPVPIGEGQTISQPYMAALMTECLQLNKEKIVLEIGTGSGYQTAVLAEICGCVYTIERIQTLSDRAKKKLDELQYSNIYFYVGDGSLGWKDLSLHFDAIMVTAACPKVPSHLLDQMKAEGRMVIPTGDRWAQTLMLFTGQRGKIEQKEICRCIFVPLVSDTI